MRNLILLLSAAGVLAAGAKAQDKAAALPELTKKQIPGPKNFTRWLKFIRPSKDELRFNRIAWRNEFWPAVQEAQKLGRPILLWTMNGHPLGCT